VKLQLNTSGAWKNVAEFDEARRWEIVQAVKALDEAIGDGKPKWCLVHDDGKREWL
jgi:hypothetical protein